MERRRATPMILVALLLLMSVPVSQVSAHDGSEPTIGWADCWFGHKENSLSTTEEADCASYYLEAPTGRLYDLRWVFLNVSAEEIPDDWTETQLANLNAVFGQWNFQFQNGEEVVIPNAVAESGDYYDEWTLRDALPDLRAQLGLSEDEATALAELKAQMAERYVSQEELDNITLDSTYNTGGMFRLASRARSESITIVVRPNLDASGRSGGPTPEFHISRGGGIELKTSQMNSPIGSTFPHEMGHYFGISHTHAPDYDTSVADFGFEQRWERMGSGGEALKAIIGDDWSGELGEPYLSYDDSDQSLTEFQDLMTDSFFWPLWEFLYSGDHEPFENLSDFVQTGESGETVYRTNFERNYEQGVSDWGGINCHWNSISDVGQCRYNDDPIIRLDSNHTLLEDKIFFENGTVANLMSYITPPYEDVTSRRGITDSQLDMIRFSANSPMRMLHTNHCLGTALCGEDEPPDDQEEPPDDQTGDNGTDNGTGDDVDTTPRISLWPGKVSQHNENGTWMTDPDGVSGGHPSSEHPNDYGDRKVEYCQKFWPTTERILLQDYQETITFYTEGNQVAYNSTKDVWICQTVDGGIPDFEPADNPPFLPGDGDEELPETPDDYDDDYGDDSSEVDWKLPGFGLPAALTMLATAAILRRRRIEY